MVYHVRGRRQMKFRQFEWLADFIFLLSLFVAMNGLLKLHSLGQPLLGVHRRSTFFSGDHQLI